MINIFSIRSHYNIQFRKELIPILRPFWKSREGYSNSEREVEYGKWVKDVIITEDESEAEIAVLPMSWNYYIKLHKSDDAIRFINRAKKAGLLIITFVSGDLGVTPLSNEVRIYRSSGYASRRSKYQHAFPVFFRDPLLSNFGKKEPVIREKTTMPIVGFCGHGYSPLNKVIFDGLRNLSRNFCYYFGLSKNEPQQIYPAIRKRERILGIVSSYPNIKTNFVIRNAYRAGAKTEEEKFNTTIEYYQNMIDSDYLICVRGNGNFSARLYETMAMGRIPVIVNTDCIYPWDDRLDWKSFTIWVEYRELDQLPAKIYSFHKEKTPEEFVGLQWQVRKLWEDYLSMPGFFSILIKDLEAETRRAK